MRKVTEPSPNQPKGREGGRKLITLRYIDECDPNSSGTQIPLKLIVKNMSGKLWKK